MAKYLVRTTINCNSSDDITNKIFTNRKKAKEYFDSQVKELVESYMEDESEDLEDWLCASGIIEDEYGGTVSETYVSFDFNQVELIEVEGE